MCHTKQTNKQKKKTYKHTNKIITLLTRTYVLSTIHTDRQTNIFSLFFLKTNRDNKKKKTAHRKKNCQEQNKKKYLEHIQLLNPSSSIALKIFKLFPC